MRLPGAASRAGFDLQALLLLAFLQGAPLAAAQETPIPPPSHPTAEGRGPDPRPRVFYIANAGADVWLSGGSGVRVILDGGVMVNLSSKNAVGGSWFTTAGDDGFPTGPMLHWRRWLGPTRSVDVAVGTPIAGPHSVRPGSVLGLVKYNPVPWFGVVVRPELLRQSEFYDLHRSRWVPSGTKSRLSLGAELGGKPGLLVGSIALVVSLVGLASFDF